MPTTLETTVAGRLRAACAYAADAYLSPLGYAVEGRQSAYRAESDADKPKLVIVSCWPVSREVMTADAEYKWRGRYAVTAAVARNHGARVTGPMELQLREALTVALNDLHALLVRDLCPELDDLDGAQGKSPASAHGAGFDSGGVTVTYYTREPA